ncbi:AzlD domain-containing protein [Pseudactinotalea sp. HY160]|uniref:AzlD domain-containing protein n=1 Tax=Pseudactinotalea sp. HY160 TaxID=2654490 RepID=UPI00128B9581|nr:AzlD domain-containing protein [Pseudactinotalea sp. HY160]MPV50561.1 AzlD domain-containing protein [Pseudactinotalea sp. HY160]
MGELTQILLGGLLLGIGTYAMRAGGGEIGDRIAAYPRFQLAVEDAAMLILASVMATSALTDGQSFAGWARPAGVALSGLLAWRGAPLPVVLLVAAAATAGLRALGIA